VADVLVRLARWRVPLGFFAGAMALWFAQPTPRSLAVGGVVAAVGEALRVWAAGHLNKSREVTASGPYRWLAHPLYVGSSVMGLGLAVASRNWIVAALVAVYVAVTLTAAVRTEEASLRARFGEAYDRYRRRGTVDPARTFSWARAVDNREHRALAGLALAFVLLLLRSFSRR
jgi:protein-S-isoprenylcysteine O-methyltransferase Ste14